MADRVAANIVIGGCVTPEQFAALAELIAADEDDRPVLHALAIG